MNSKRILREAESVWDDSMSIDSLEKGQASQKEQVRRLQNLTKIFKEGVIDFVFFEAIISAYILPYAKNFPKELTKNVSNPDLAESQTLNPPPDTAFSTFRLYIRKVLGTGSENPENKEIINEILNNGISNDNQKNQMELLNDKVNDYWKKLLYQDKQYEDHINSINMKHYDKEVALDLKRAKDNFKAGRNYSAYTREIPKPKLLKQNVPNLEYEDYLPILSKIGIKESKKLTLKSYLEKKLTVSPKEAELIESVIKEYVRNKKVK